MERRVVLLGVLVAAVCLGGAFWPSWEKHSAKPRAEQSDEAARREPPAPASQLRIPSPAPTTSLPATEVPLAHIVDDLKRRASQGEAAAGCRLAAEYLYCSQLPHRKAELDYWLGQRRSALDSLESPEMKQAAIETIEREGKLREDHLREIEDHCEGVEIAAGTELVLLWRSAAMAGNPSAMKQYASGNAFRLGNILEVLPALNTYKREAESIAILAAQRGDMDMLLSLAAAYYPIQSELRPLMAQAVRQDGARALALYRQIEQALAQSGNASEQVAVEVRERIRHLQEQLPREDIVRAATIEATEISHWTPPTVRGAHRLNTTGRVRDVDRAWCAR